MNIDAEAVIAAFLPALFWLWLVYSRDRYDPEPKKLIAKLFAMGLPAVIVAGIPEAFIPLQLDGGSVLVVAGAVICVGLVEEGAKFAAMWLLVRRHPAFDEPVDGMVYASSVALGFAAIETTLYLIVSYRTGLLHGETPALAWSQSFLILAPIRALAGAGGHLSWAGNIGYWYGRHHIEGTPRRRIVLAYLASAAAHAAYDGFLAFGAVIISACILVVSAVAYVHNFHRALAASPFRARQWRPVPASPPNLHDTPWHPTDISAQPLPALAGPHAGGAVMGWVPAQAPVMTVERLGDWAHVLAPAGWSGWVDGRMLNRVTMPVPPPPPPAAWVPTHHATVGMPSWSQPDPGSPAAGWLQPGLGVLLTERRGDWAHVSAPNGWSGWVDGRNLVAQPA